MSENRNLPLMLSILGIFLVAVGIVLANLGPEVTGLDGIQPFFGLGVVLAILGIIVLLVAFLRMRPRRPIRWRIKKTPIEP